MVRKVFLGLITSLSFCFAAHSMIRRIVDKDTIELAEIYLDWADIVVLDLDNTVMYSSDVLEANCQWCDFAERRLQETWRFTKAEAFKKMVHGYDEFNRKATMVPTEERFVDFIRDAQDRKIPVIAITGRPDMMCFVTVKKLASIGVDFARGGLFRGRDFMQVNGAHFIDGIIYNGYLGSPQKGESLKLFLDRLNLKPKNILMIDDRQYCLESVQTHLPGVNFMGIRYGRCDSAFKCFKPTPEMCAYIDTVLVPLDVEH